MSRTNRLVSAAMLVLGLALAVARPAQAELGPDGSEYAMADWLVLSYFVFFLFALVVFLIALKQGLFKDVEEAKYYIMTIDEPDFYTPDWAKEDPDDTDREHD